VESKRCRIAFSHDTGVQLIVACVKASLLKHPDMSYIHCCSTEALCSQSSHVVCSSRYFLTLACLCVFNSCSTLTSCFPVVDHQLQPMSSLAFLTALLTLLTLSQCHSLWRWYD